MATPGFHCFTRWLLWRVAGLCTILLVAAWMFGAGSVWQIVQWIPMTIVVVIVVAHVASFIRARG